MRKNYEKIYHDVETNHWWFKSRRNYLMDLLKNASKDSKILDIGCSSGIFLKDLEKLGFNPNNLFGIDISKKAISNCKKSGLQNTFVMDAQEINLKEQFDIIIASDCLEHLQEDEKALQNWKTLLKPNGTMYVFVPAFTSLWSYHDTINQHFRRYTKNQLKRKLEKQGLKIQKASYWNFLLFLPVYSFRRISGLFKNKNSGDSDIQMSNGFINNSLLNLMNLENKLLKHLNFPFGISVFCIVTKKKP
jgi:2-polyprenyl-3-methyl-5-hydroxy-6-metoxy-1,4-benzoquinol methylase